MSILLLVSLLKLILSHSLYLSAGSGHSLSFSSSLPTELRPRVAGHCQEHRVHHELLTLSVAPPSALHRPPVSQCVSECVCVCEWVWFLSRQGLLHTDRGRTGGGGEAVQRKPHSPRQLHRHRHPSLHLSLLHNVTLPQYGFHMLALYDVTQ